MNRTQKWTALALCLLMAVGLALPVAAEPEQVLRIGLEQDIETVDPQQNTAAFTCAVGEGISEPLLREQMGETLPGLAESYTTEDNIVWTFKLRENAAWSDGTPIVASDLVWSYQEIFTRPECAKVYVLFQGVLGYDELIAAIEGGSDADAIRAMAQEKLGVVAQDDHTLVVTLQSPRPWYVSTFCCTAWAPLKRDLYEKYGTTYGSSKEAIASNGPFVIAEWAYNEKVVLEKNPNYWNAANIALDKVELIIVKGDEPRVNMFKEGKIDVARAPSEYLTTMPDQVLAVEGTSWSYLLVNSYRRNAEGALVDETSSKMLGNRNFLAAMNNAINREALFTNIVVDPARRATGYCIPGSVNSNNAARQTVGELRGDKYVDVAPVTKNVGAAKTYLDAALKELGYASATDLPKLTLVCASSADPVAICEYLKNALEQGLGISVTVEPVEFNVRDSRIISGDYDLLYMGWGASTDDALDYLQVWTDDLFATGWPQSDPEGHAKFCELLTFIANADDADARAQKIIEAEELLMRQGQIITLSNAGTAALVSDRVEGFTMRNFNSLYDFAHAKIVK